MDYIPHRSQSLLVVIDLINAFGPPQYSPTPELPIYAIDENFIIRTNQLLKKWEQKGWPVVFISDAHHPEDWTQLHEKPHALTRTTAAEIMQWVYLPIHALYFTKRTYNGCSNQEFCEYLRKEVFSTIYVIGTSTGKCVRHTVQGMRQLTRVPIVLIEDLMADISGQRHQYYLDFFQQNSDFQVITYMELKQMRFKE